jgi:hypothetical protein
MTSTVTCCISLKKTKQIDQDKIIEILDQAKAPEWHEAMVDANIDNFEMTYEESVSYFKQLEKIRHQQSQSFLTTSR